MNINLTVYVSNSESAFAGRIGTITTVKCGAFGVMYEVTFDEPMNDITKSLFFDNEIESC